MSNKQTQNWTYSNTKALSTGTYEPRHEKTCLRGLRPACTATEASWRLQISDIESRSIMLSRQRTAKVLIRLRGRAGAGWSVPLLFAYGKKQVFSWCGSNRPEQTVQTEIRLLLQIQSDGSSLHCLPLCLHHLDVLQYDKSTFFKF